MITFYLKCTPLTEGTRLKSPKEYLKSVAGTTHTCWMAPNGKGAWLYKVDCPDAATQTQIMDYIVGIWTDVVGLTPAEAETYAVLITGVSLTKPAQVIEAKSEVLKSVLYTKDFSTIANYIDVNVTDLASAKKVMIVMAKVIIGLVRVNQEV